MRHYLNIIINMCEDCEKESVYEITKEKLTEGGEGYMAKCFYCTSTYRIYISIDKQGSSFVEGKENL